jgi:hypothetical protein
MSDKHKALKDLLDEEWNKAIEEAAKASDKNNDYRSSHLIRQLKRSVGK